MAAGALGQQRLLDQLKPACARILDAERTLLGSGYLVAANLVATCHHVVGLEIPSGGKVVCRFGDVEPVERSGKVLRWDEARDTALVQLDQPAPAAPLPLGGDASDLAWYGYGFPGFAEPAGTPLFGRVLDAHTVDKDGRPACTLHVEQFDGRVPESVGGISGSAAVSDGKVIGTVFRVLGSSEGWKQPNFGLCFATPVWTLRALLAASGEGDVSGQIVGPAAQPSTPTVAEARARVAGWETGAVCLEAIRLADSSSAVAQGIAAYERTALGGHQALLAGAEVLIGLGAPKAALLLLGKLDAERAVPAPVLARALQLRALALSLDGQDATAQAILRQATPDAETSGILGGILKRRWIETGRVSWLHGSYRAYKAGNDATPDAYLSINVAALALLRGDAGEARHEAERTLALVAEKTSPGYWDVATRAEALLLLGRLEEAREQYREAALACGRPRELAVMRRQARLELAALGHDPHLFDGELVPGAVACILAAPVDPGFWTKERSLAVRNQLEALVRQRGVVYGYGAATAGPDLVFADVLRKRDATATVYVPGPPQAFEAAFVPPGWAPFLRGVPLDRLVVLSPDDKPPDGKPPVPTFGACDDALTRAATEMGARLDQPPVLLAFPPPPGVEDVRHVRATMETWPARCGGDVVELRVP